MEKAVFLDRDGTLIKAIQRIYFEHDFTAPFLLSELQFIDGVENMFVALKRLDFLRIMVTNQPDVRRGFVLEDEWNAIQARVTRRLEFEDVFMCRHIPEEDCPLRKPSPMMLFAAADKWNINLCRSYMVGDNECDIIAGRKAGCTTILINAPYNKGVDADIIVNSLHEVVRAIEKSRV